MRLAEMEMKSTRKNLDDLAKRLQDLDGEVTLVQILSAWSEISCAARRVRLADGIFFRLSSQYAIRTILAEWLHVCDGSRMRAESTHIFQERMRAESTQVLAETAASWDSVLAETTASWDSWGNRVQLSRVMSSWLSFTESCRALGQLASRLGRARATHETSTMFEAWLYFSQRSMERRQTYTALDESIDKLHMEFMNKLDTLVCKRRPIVIEAFSLWLERCRHCNHRQRLWLAAIIKEWLRVVVDALCQQSLTRSRAISEQLLCAAHHRSLLIESLILWLHETRRNTDLSMLARSQSGLSNLRILFAWAHVCRDMQTRRQAVSYWCSSQQLRISSAVLSKWSHSVRVALISRQHATDLCSIRRNRVMSAILAQWLYGTGILRARCAETVWAAADNTASVLARARRRRNASAILALWLQEALKLRWTKVAQVLLMNMALSIALAKARKRMSTLLAIWWHEALGSSCSRVTQLSMKNLASALHVKLDLMLLKTHNKWLLERAFRAWSQATTELRCRSQVGASVKAHQQTWSLRGAVVFESLTRRCQSWILLGQVLFAWSRRVSTQQLKCRTALIAAGRNDRGCIAQMWRVWTSRHQLLRRQLRCLRESSEQGRIEGSCFSGWVLSAWARATMLSKQSLRQDCAPKLGAQHGKSMYMRIKEAGGAASTTCSHELGELDATVHVQTRPDSLERALHHCNRLYGQLSDKRSSCEAFMQWRRWTHDKSHTF